MTTLTEIIKSFLIFVAAGITVIAIVFGFLFLVTYIPVYLLWGIPILMWVILGTHVVYKARKRP